MQSNSESNMLICLLFAGQFISSYHCLCYICNVFVSISSRCNMLQRQICMFMAQMCKNRRVSEMWTPLVACRDPVGSYNRFNEVLSVLFFFFFNTKRNLLEFKRHLLTLWYFDTSVICPHRFRGVKFVIIPPCFG